MCKTPVLKMAILEKYYDKFQDFLCYSSLRHYLLHTAHQQVMTQCGTGSNYLLFKLKIGSSDASYI